MARHYPQVKILNVTQKAHDLALIYASILTIVHSHLLSGHSTRSSLPEALLLKLLHFSNSQFVLHLSA